MEGDTPAPDTGAGGIPVGGNVGNEGTSSDEQTSTEPTPSPTTGTDTTEDADSTPSESADTTPEDDSPERANTPVPSSDAAGIVGRFTTDEAVNEYLPEIQQGTAEDRSVFTVERADETLVLSAESQSDVRDLLNTNTKVNVVNQTPGVEDTENVTIDDGNVSLTEEGQEQRQASLLDEQYPDVDVAASDVVGIENTDSGVQPELNLQTQRQLVAAQQGVDLEQVTFTSDGFQIEREGQPQSNPLQQGTDALTGAAPVPAPSPTELEENQEARQEAREQRQRKQAYVQWKLQKGETPAGVTTDTEQTTRETPFGNVPTGERTTAQVDYSQVEVPGYFQEDWVDDSQDTRSIEDDDLAESDIPGQSGATPGSQNQGQETVAPTARQVQLAQGDSSDAIQTQFGGLGAVFSQQITDPVADVSGDVADLVVSGGQFAFNSTPAGDFSELDDDVQDIDDAFTDITRAPENEVAEESTAEGVTTKVTTGAVDIAKTPATLPATLATIGETAKGSVEFTGDAIADEGVVEGTQESVTAAGETTTNYLGQQAQYAANNPFVTAGTLIGSAAIMGGAARISNNAGLASRAAIQPAEELLGYGGNAALRGTGSSIVRAGRRVPGRVGSGVRTVGQKTRGSAEKLFPDNEPLLFSEEAAIRAGKRVGSGVRRTGQAVKSKTVGDDNILGSIEPSPRQQDLIAEARPIDNPGVLASEFTETTVPESRPVSAESDIEQPDVEQRELTTGERAIVESTSGATGPVGSNPVRTLDVTTETETEVEQPTESEISTETEQEQAESTEPDTGDGGTPPLYDDVNDVLTRGFERETEARGNENAFDEALEMVPDNLRQLESDERGQASLVGRSQTEVEQEQERPQQDFQDFSNLERARQSELRQRRNLQSDIDRTPGIETRTEQATRRRVGTETEQETESVTRAELNQSPTSVTDTGLGTETGIGSIVGGRLETGPQTDTFTETVPGVDVGADQAVGVGLEQLQEIRPEIGQELETEQELEQELEQETETEIEQEAEQELEQEARREAEVEDEFERFEFDFDTGDDDSGGLFGSVAQAQFTDFVNPLTGETLETTGLQDNQ
jgi:hypothetical protein